MRPQFFKHMHTTNLLFIHTIFAVDSILIRFSASVDAVMTKVLAYNECSVIFYHRYSLYSKYSDYRCTQTVQFLRTCLHCQILLPLCYNLCQLPGRGLHFCTNAACANRENMSVDGWDYQSMMHT